VLFEVRILHLIVECFHFTFFRTVLCGEITELSVNVASIAADFLSKTCVPGSFVASKQAALELVDCLSAFADSNSSVWKSPFKFGF